MPARKARPRPGAPSPVDRAAPRRHRRWAVLAALTVAGTTAAVAATASTTAQASASGFLSRFSNVVVGPSTVPANGDVNPYGVAVVPQTTGSLVAGGVLVSNFNDQANAQGTGTTIVEELPDGSVVPFAQIDQASPAGPCPGGIGLTTALDVLPGGWVVVGSLPTSAAGPLAQGSPEGTGPGCLVVLNADGQMVETWAGGHVDGPWDMTEVTAGPDAFLFVTNVLNGTLAADAGVPADEPGRVVDDGTVVRIKVALGSGVPAMVSQTVVADGFAERTDPSALVVGPTGVAVAPDDTLYVSDSVNNRIAEVPDALWRPGPFAVPGGLTLSRSSALDDPLGMALAPDDDVLTVNGNNGSIVETAPSGQTVATATLDDTGPPPGGVGDLFGLAVAPGGRGVWFVDDGTNTLDLLF